jgi:predicted PurR-regulated permease PerM
VPREQLFAAFFFAVFLFLLYQLYLFLAGFFAPLLWAAILALTFFPLTDRLVQLMQGRRGLAALVLLVGVTVIAVLPSFLLGSVLVGEATGAYERLQEAVRDGEFTRLLARLQESRLGGLWAHVAPLANQVSLDVSDVMLRAASWLSDEIVGQAGALAKNVLVSVIDLLLMLVALFFFFRDGQSMAERLRELLPMSDVHKRLVFARLYTTVSAVVQSMVITAAAQGTLAGIGYWLIGGLSFSLFLGFLTGLASFLPLAGPAFVWASVAAYLALAGSPGHAIALAVWGTFAVSGIDNWIKPMFIGGRARLPTFLLLMSILGGLKVYGFIGVFLGPVVLAVLITFVEIYRELYGEPPAAVPVP